MLQLEIVTPEKLIYKDSVDELVVPTTTGEIAILPNHAALFTQVAAGEIAIKKGGKTQFMAVSGGFLQVEKNMVNLLADYAVRSEEIEIAKAEEARKRAEKAMAEKATDRDFALAESAFKKAVLELKVARRRKAAI